MMTWLKRGILCGCLLLVVLLAALYWGAVALLQACLQPQLTARDAALEVASIRLRATGLELQLARYQDASRLLRDVVVTCPWSQLLDLGRGFAGTVSVGELHLDLRAVASGSDTVEAASLSSQVAAQVATLAAQLDALPVNALDLVVHAIYVELPGRSFAGRVEGSLLTGANDDTHLAAMLSTDDLDLDLRLRVSAGGSRLAVDFVAATTTWEAFRDAYLSELSSTLAANQVELYINRLGEDRGFADLSGYARWDQAAPQALSFTVLAELGDSELYWPQGELILQPAALGLANDASGHLHAYGKGALDSVRADSWMQSGGDWALRVDASALAAELRLGDTFELSLAHEDWRQLMQGSGAGRLYLKADAVDAECVRALQLQSLPDDLSFDLALQVEAEGQLSAWQPADASILVNAQLASLSVASQGLTLEDLDAHAQLQLVEAQCLPASLDLSVERLDLLGFEMQRVQLAAQANDSGLFQVDGLQAAFAGGTVQLDPFILDPENVSASQFRLQLKQMQLAQLAEVVPQFKGDISGQLSGYLVGQFKGGQPILTDGRLEVDPDSGARLSYDVAGLLTRGMSETSPSYQQYRMAERAFEDLALKRFSIDVFPEGSETRPLRLELFGESKQGQTVVPVDFNLNINVDDTAGVLEILRMIQSGNLDLK
jgi:hypothetical protein